MTSPHPWRPTSSRPRGWPGWIAWIHQAGTADRKRLVHADDLPIGLSVRFARALIA